MSHCVPAATLTWGPGPLVPHGLQVSGRVQQVAFLLLCVQRAENSHQLSWKKASSAINILQLLNPVRSAKNTAY